MEMRTGVGWQYALTDLSLILFMVAASGLVKVPTVAGKAPLPISAPSPAPAPAVADPVAIWRPGAGMPTLSDWLASQPRDSRERLTIVAHYTGSSAAGASARAADLLAGAGKSAGQVRLLVEPGADEDLSATLTWDAGSVAQNGATQ